MLKRLLLYPFWFFELFTTAKSFRTNPVIGNYWLNRMGLHVLRLLGAHSIMYLRMWLLGWFVSADERRSYFRDGFLQKEGLVDASELQALQAEIAHFDCEIREALQGDTFTRRTVVEPDCLQCTVVLKKLLHASSFRYLCNFTGGHVRPPLFYIETVKKGFHQGDKDPQKTFHSDTFHPTMKCWFFPNEVKPEEGPFTYYPGSHKLTWKRIKWEYKMSLEAKHCSNRYAASGSFRFTPRDIEELGLDEPVSFTVKPNTLLFANTFGIHRRGDGQAGVTRTALWGDSRTNPFIPFPGVSSDAINALQYKMLADFRRRADKAAEKKGERPPWKLIDKS